MIAPQMCFEVCADGRLEPMPFRRPDGSFIQADGVKLLSIEDAAKLSGQPADQLDRRWKNLIAPLTPAADQVFLTPAPATPAAPSQTGLGDAELDGKTMAGETEVACPVVFCPPMITQSDVDLLRATRFPDISDEHVRQFVAFCYKRNLSPFWEHVYCQLVTDRRSGGRPRLVMIMQIAGLRLLAIRSNDFAGIDKVIFNYGTEERFTPAGKRIPISAECTIYRFVGGRRVPVSDEVFWDDYYPVGGDSLYDTMPMVCLGRCVKAAVYRAAYPAETGEFYTPEEMRQSRGRARAAAAEPERHTDSDGRAFDGDVTPMQFELKLVEEFGLSRETRLSVIETFKDELPQQYARDRQAWYSAVMRAIRQNPARYGAKSSREMAEV